MSTVEGAATEAPLLRDVAPELEAEITQLLIEAGESALAAKVVTLRIHDRCRCGDDFCSSFYTVRNRTTPFPSGFRTLALRPGGLHLDVLDTTILQVEVLFRDDFKAKLAVAVP